MTNNIIGYLVEASIYLTFCWLVYRFILSRFTFFLLNRYFLLTGVIGSLLLPIMPNLFEIEFDITQSTLVSELIPSETIEEITETNAIDKLSPLVSTNNHFNYSAWIIAIFKIGIILFLIRFIWILFNSLDIIFNAEKGKIGKYSIYFHPSVKKPCSLFSRILFPESWKDTPKKISNEILLHEKAHATQYHWLDLIIVEFVAIFFWFLPPIYFLKKSFNINLEFLADKAALKYSDIEYYQLQLLQELQPNSQLALAHTFYSTPIKTRFKMMKKTPTPIWKKTVYAVLTFMLLLPTIALTPKEYLLEVAPLPNEFETMISLLNDKEYYPDFLPIKKEKLINEGCGWGMHMHPILKVRKMHTGVDFIAPQGTAIYAAASGVVRKAYSNYKTGYGIYIEIEHGNTGLVTKYAHLEKFIVKEGQKVKKGETIAYVGNTGFSVSPHLHFEIIQDGRKVNPANFFRQNSLKKK